MAEVPEVTIPKILARIAAVTPQQGVGEFQGLGVGERRREEYERIAGLSS